MRIIALGDRDPTHLTHREIDATLALLRAQVDCGWVATDSAEARELHAVDAVWLLPGTPYRDDSAARAAIHHCLETGTPFLGTCGGFQYACVELARVLAGVSEATSAELDPGGSALVVAPLACSLYGERRTVTPVPGTRLAAICGVEPFEGHHHCGYGLADPMRRCSPRPASSSQLMPPTRGWRASSCPTIGSLWPPRSSPRSAAARAAPCTRWSRPWSPPPRFSHRRSIWVAHRERRVSVSDRGAALRKAGAVAGWERASARVHAELDVNITRGGMVWLPVVAVGPSEQEVAERIGRASLIFFQELLELGQR